MKCRLAQFFGVTTACLALLISTESISAQEQSPAVNSQSTPPTDARYQIVESTLTVRDTFRIDRFTGRVWRIVKNDAGDNLWEEMIVKDRPDLESSISPRFQLFLSGVASRMSLLLDTQTGRTWQIDKSKIDPNGVDDDSNTVTIWTPISIENIAGDLDVPMDAHPTSPKATDGGQVTPSLPPGMAEAWLSFAKQRPYGVNPSPSVTAAALHDWDKSVAAYFPGRSLDSITQAEWARFAADGFVRPPVVLPNSTPATAPSEWDQIGAPQR